MAGRSATPAALKEWFRDIDTNRNGKLDFSELSDFLWKGDPGITSKQIKTIFKALDRDGDGEICFDEMVDFVFSPNTGMGAALRPAGRKTGRLATTELTDLRVRELAKTAMPRIQQVELYGSILGHAIDGIYCLPQGDLVVSASAGRSEFVNMYHNDKPKYESESGNLKLLYGWTLEPRKVGWFLLRYLPGEGIPIEDFELFNNSPYAQFPSDCGATWESMIGSLDKRLCVEKVDNGRSRGRRFKESWRGQGLVDRCLDSELWKEFEYGELNDDDYGLSWETQPGEEWPMKDIWTELITDHDEEKEKRKPKKGQKADKADGQTSSMISSLPRAINSMPFGRMSVTEKVTTVDDQRRSTVTSVTSLAVVEITSTSEVRLPPLQKRGMLEMPQVIGSRPSARSAREEEKSVTKWVSGGNSPSEIRFDSKSPRPGEVPWLLTKSASTPAVDKRRSTSTVISDPVIAKEIDRLPGLGSLIYSGPAQPSKISVKSPRSGSPDHDRSDSDPENYSPGPDLNARRESSDAKVAPSRTKAQRQALRELAKEEQNQISKVLGKDTLTIAPGFNVVMQKGLDLHGFERSAVGTTAVAEVLPLERLKPTEKKEVPRMKLEERKAPPIFSVQEEEVVEEEVQEPKRIKRDGIEVDKGFRPGDKALGITDAIRERAKRLEKSNEDSAVSNSQMACVLVSVDNWMRLSHVMKKTCLFHRVLPNDVVCELNAPNFWFLSACAAVAEYPAWIHMMFGHVIELNPYGKYVVRLFNPAKCAFVRLIVDEFVPCTNGSPAFAGISAEGAIWVPLVEKCLSKFCGSYAAMEKGEVAFGMHYLCGGSGAERWDRLIRPGPRGSGTWQRTNLTWTQNGPVRLKDEVPHRQESETKTVQRRMVEADEFWGRLRIFMERCFPVAAEADPMVVTGTGLSCDRMYSMLGAREVPVKREILRMVFLRNPFGVTRWEGRWGHDSDVWDANLGVKEMLQFEKNETDGTFWISYIDFLKHFQAVHVCRKSMPVQGAHHSKQIGLKRGLGMLET